MFRLVDKTNYRNFAAMSLKAADKALYDLARYIQQAAVWSIKSTNDMRKYSPPGTPFFSHRQNSMTMKKSLIVEREEGRALIGYFRGNIVGDIHEFGGVNPLNKKFYPARPVLGPALEKGKSDFARKFPEAFNKYFRRNMQAA